MTGNLFPDPATPKTENPEPAKPALTPVPDEQTKQLEILSMTLLGLDANGRAITALEQDGRDPDDATYTIVIDNQERVTLQGISTLMSRPKIRDILLVRLGVTPATMKAAEWQDTIATAIAQAATIVETSQSLVQRVQDWVQQYLAWAHPTIDLDTACINREPWKDPEHRTHLVIGRLAKWVSTNTTEKLTERQLASALRDAQWDQKTLMYWTEGREPNGKGRGKRTSASYWRSPPENDDVAS